MKRIYLLLLTILSFGCADSQSIDPKKFEGRIDVVIDTPILRAIAATDQEKEIQSATIVLYDKNKAYLDHEVVTGNSTSQIIVSFVDIPESALPVSAIAVVNIEGAWELSGVSDWTKTTSQVVDQLTISNKATVKQLAVGTTPLAMYGTGGWSSEGAIHIALNRPMAKVVVTNKSNMTIDNIAFSELNGSVGINETFVPSTTSGGFTMVESGIAFAKEAMRTYYLMPTASDQVQVEFRSGLTTKRVLLKKIIRNTHHTVNVTITPEFDVNISISSPENWEEDTVQDL